MFAYLMIAGYLLLLVGVTVIAHRKTKTLDDFFLGGRGIGPWMSAMAYGTTYFSAVLFIGYAGQIGWNFGLSGVWVGIGNSIIGCLLAWLVLAKRTREMTGKLGVRTMPEFLEARFDSRNLKIFSALIIFIFLVPYSASVFMGLSYLFEEVFGISYSLALALITIFTLIYLVFGGYLAVNLADVIQGVIMIAGMLLLLKSIVWHPEAGGIIAGINKLHSIDPALTTPIGPPGFIPMASLVILTSLGSWGLPQMIHKFYAVKDDQSIKIATIVTTIFALILAGGAYFLGSYTHLFFDAVPLENGKPNTDLLMPMLINRVVPEALTVLIVILILSASMSTLSSLVLVSSSVISIDLAGTLLPKLSAKASLRVMRACCAVFVLLSLWLATARPGFILTLMSISWGTIAGVFLAPYLYGLYYKKATRTGAWAAALTGLAISLGFNIALNFSSAKVPMVGSLAMLVPLLVLPAVSLVTQDVPAHVVSKAFPVPSEN